MVYCDILLLLFSKKKKGRRKKRRKFVKKLPTYKTPSAPAFKSILFARPHLLSAEKIVSPENAKKDGVQWQ